MRDYPSKNKFQFSHGPSKNTKRGTALNLHFSLKVLRKPEIQM